MHSELNKSKIQKLWFLNVDMNSGIGLGKVIVITFLVLQFLGTIIGLYISELNSVVDWIALTFSSIILGISLGSVVFLLIFIVIQIFE